MLWLRLADAPVGCLGVRGLLFALGACGLSAAAAGSLGAALLAPLFCGCADRSSVRGLAAGASDCFEVRPACCLGRVSREGLAGRASLGGDLAFLRIVAQNNLSACGPSSATAGVQKACVHQRTVAWPPAFAPLGSDWVQGLPLGALPRRCAPRRWVAGC